MWRACLILLAACNFDHGVLTDSNTNGDAPACMTTPPWWDSAFVARFPLAVSAPAGYTLRVDASAALAAGPDVRVVVHDPMPREIDRLLDAPSVTFKVPASGSVWLYAGPGAGTAKANPANVYLFAEDFEAITLDTNADGPFDPQPPNEWTVIADGSANRVYHAAGIARHPAAIRGLMPNNVEIEARMRVGAGGGDNHNGLAVRSNNMTTTAMDGFICQLQENGSRWRLAEYVNGTSPTDLAGIPRAVTKLVWYRVRLRVIGDVLTLYVDDEQIATATKTGSDGQLIGLFAFNSDVDYDDVRVRMAATPEPTATVGAEQRCK